MYQLRCPNCDNTKLVSQDDGRTAYQVTGNDTVKSKAESLRGRPCDNCSGLMTAVRQVESPWA